MDQNWVNIVKWHDGIDRYALEVESCRICRFYCEPSNPKKVRGTLKGPCCRPMVGAPNLDLVSYLYERWSAQAKNHSVVGSPIEQRLIICAIYAFFERATKCHQTKIYLYALGVHFVHVLYSVIFNRISASVWGQLIIYA